MSKFDRASALAGQILRLSRDTILVNLRFLDVAISRLVPQAKADLKGVACNGVQVYYDPVYLLRRYKEESGYGVRLYLHILFHCIFYHSFQSHKLESRDWDLAADLAVEASILELRLSAAALKKDEEAREKLRELKERSGLRSLTAEKLYRFLREEPPEEEERKELVRLFCMDDHCLWKPAKGQEELAITREQWEKISQRVKADLKSFSKGKSQSESLEKNLAEATRDRYDYADLLKRFTVMGETVQVNDDEFDYIYYTYGLSRYGNMPLIEPLEYKEARKVKEFVIAIDTSASCRGSLVQAFLKKTYSILKGTENFFQRINVHIVQCDNEVQSDTRITSEEDFDVFMSKLRLQGFGSTDFGPVFAYVEELLAAGEFENLKGLIYFTDGYGVYPRQMPAYDVIFAFLGEDDKIPPVPPWAIKVVLEEEDVQEGPGSQSERSVS